MLTEADLTTSAERRLWTAIETGAEVDANDEGEDQRTVRAELLIELLTREQRPSGNRPRALRLAGATVTGNLDLSGLTLVCSLAILTSVFEEAVSLDNAQVASLDLSGSRLPQVSAYQLQTRGSVILDDITAESVMLPGARIGGLLALRGATLAAEGGRALFADRIEVRESTSLSGLAATGEVRLLGARIAGQLVVEDARLENPAGIALILEGATVGAGVFANRLETVGGVSMVTATIHGNVGLADAVIECPDGNALSCDGLTAQNFRAGRLRANGLLRFIGAQIAGEVILDGAQLEGPSEPTFSGDNLSIGTNLFCQDGFSLTGGMRLDHATIGVGVGFRNARLTNPDGIALDANMIEVGQHLLLGRDFAADGDVALSGARIDGALDLVQATIGAGGKLDLTGAHIGEFGDYAWPDEATRALSTDRPYEPHINGFVYDRLTPGTDDIATRLDWIAYGEQAYIPQAYDQLAAAYRAAGREEDAREVMVAKQRRKRGQLRLPGRMWNRFLDITVGFGYHTGRAVFGLLAVMLIGWPIFAWASWDHLEPLKDTATLPQFEPWLYSIDAVLPVITLGQESSWGPTGVALYWYVFSVLSGWILGTALIAALTAMLNRS